MGVSEEAIKTITDLIRAVVDRLFKHTTEFDITIDLRSGERPIGTLHLRGTMSVKPIE